MYTCWKLQIIANLIFYIGHLVNTLPYFSCVIVILPIGRRLNERKIEPLRTIVFTYSKLTCSRFHRIRLILNDCPNSRFGMQSLLIPAHVESPSEIISSIYTHIHTHTRKNEKTIKTFKMNYSSQLCYF